AQPAAAAAAAPRVLVLGEDGPAVHRGCIKELLVRGGRIEKDVEAGHGLAKGSTDGIRIQEVEGFREPVAAAALAFEPEAEIPEATDALPDGRAADSETARQFLAGMETAVGQLPEDRAVRIHGARGLLLLRL